ncbi:MAG TPA: phage integrase N-terminal domain-containing protein [Gammaproteobacteria bacterium]|nr:phage integrase N-terminal domain-containing protein [Gammaproteobacteria bacterium]
MNWKITLQNIIKQHNKTAAVGGKAVSFATQDARQEILWLGFKELRTLGFKLDNVRGFKERHIMALVQGWETRGLSASTIQNRVSIFRTFAEWIGKKGMVRRSENYVKNPDSVIRHLVTQTDKTWSGQGISLEDKLATIQKQDCHIAIQLKLQRAFGLRMKEAALLKPHGADKGAYLAVNWGTKGGRDRIIPVVTDHQREVLAEAKRLAIKPNDSMTPNWYNFKQWRNHYYYVCQKSGISRQEGITSHGLRHERLNEIYQEITGVESPIKNRYPNIDRDCDQTARQEIAEVAGHSRSSIAAAYIG